MNDPPFPLMFYEVFKIKNVQVGNNDLLSGTEIVPVSIN